MSSALIMQSPCTAPRKKQVLSQRLQTVNQQHIPDDGLLLSHWKIRGQPLIFIHEINTTTNWITAHGQMQQPGDVPQDELVESTGRCSDQQRSREVKLFHYERTRVVFIHSLLLLRRGGLRGNGDGYLTLEAKGLLQTIQCFSHYWWRSGNCSTDTHWEEATEKKRGEKAQRKLLEETRNSPIIPVLNDQENTLPPRLDEQGVPTVHTAKTHALQPNLNNNNDHSGR